MQRVSNRFLSLRNRVDLGKKLIIFFNNDLYILTIIKTDVLRIILA